MLTKENAKMIGLEACDKKLGFDFVKKYAGTSTSCWGYDDESDSMFCFVGVDTNPEPLDDYVYMLDSVSRFPYSASCYVSMKDGSITYLDCKLPDQI